MDVSGIIVFGRTIGLVDRDRKWCVSDEREGKR